jgi:hypothetical protein
MTELPRARTWSLSGPTYGGSWGEDGSAENEYDTGDEEDEEGNRDEVRNRRAYKNSDDNLDDGISTGE